MADTDNIAGTKNNTETPRRRWPRRVAVGVVLTGAVLGGAAWYLGRESTLQMLAQKVASASGGTITMTGVSGSLYGAMHIGRVVYRTPEQVVTGDNIDIDWSPLQYMSSGVTINKLVVATITTRALKESTEPARMPVTLAPPFQINVGDARIGKVTMFALGASEGADVTDVRFKLHGDKQQWQLRDASAATPFGLARANATIGAAKPFKLDATASLTQSEARAGLKPAQFNLRAGGDLNLTQLDVQGQSGSAVGDGKFTLAPFEPIVLRAMTINGRGIDPGFFNPALPTADLSIAVTASVDPQRNVAGQVVLDNKGPVGTIDQQRLPLRAMRGQLSGNLNALKISDVLVDFGAAGKFTGTGGVQRKAGDPGLGAADFTLHTGRIDLKQLHGRLKQTAIAGDIRVANAGNTQTFSAQLAERGMRLDAEATLENNVLQIQQARLAAGSSSVRITGSAGLAGEQPFKVSANATRFNPAAFGDLPVADINADLNASGTLAKGWKVAADFALRPSRLFDQPLSGKGKLDADATHVSGVDATLALGQNTIALRGSFGAPGERLSWRVDGKQLAAARSDLYGAVVASGVVTGTMQAPRTTFEVDARSLGWVREARAANDSLLHASGEAWLTPAGARDAARSIEIKTSGTAQRFNPAAFGAFLPGSINGAFDASGRLGADWRGAVNLTLQPSTLSKSPLWGHARFSATPNRVSGADVDLHVGPNVLAAKGSFGAAGDKLDWRIDATQLAAIGPNFGGALRGSGALSGSIQAPAVNAALEGHNLKLPGGHQVKALRASASLGAGRGGATPLVSDIEVTEYSGGATRVAQARLQTNGTRAAHSLRFGARGEGFDAAAEARGGWANDAWTGAIDSLLNRGRYAFTLQAPVPLRLGVAPGAGATGMARPQQITLGNAVIRLPNGSVNVASLNKNGARWSSKGGATGVPLNYLAQFSDAVREHLSGDLTLGAQWDATLVAAAPGGSPAMNGMFHVFREGGDMIAGAVVPVALGLRKLDARADVAGNALRMRFEVDGTRAGRAQVDASATMLAGRLGNASPLRLTANADMGSIAWLAPLTGQPALEMDGALKLAVTGAGTVGAPTLNGTVSGDSLALRWADQGVKLRNGQLRAQLAGDQLLLQRLSFEGEQGSAVADGAIRFSGGEATMQLKLVADRLEILSRPDRTVVVSGEGSVVRDAKRFAVEGKFRANRALIELAPQDRPTLSDDVIVLGRAGVGTPTKAEPAVPLTMDIEADLGNAFRLRGMGIDARLAGAVRLRTMGGRAPRVNGTIRVTEGNYAAYGQKLTVERGVINFSGPYDNPSLNVLAVRKRPEGEQLTEDNVEAGVEIRGTALSPVAKLVSTPNVPDSEKLSWLVLGHGMEATSGNESALLSAAAGALFGGKGGSGGITKRLANTLGVDELGVGQANGKAPGLESTVITVGKRISRRLYVTFEQGTGAASSLVRLRYKLNPRITLQVQAGTNTAFDVLYSWAFD